MIKFLKPILLIIALVLTCLGLYFFEEIKNISDQLANSDMFVAEKIASPAARNDSPDADTTEKTDTAQSLPYEVAQVATGLFVPWSIAFTSENRFLVTERNGSIKAVVDDVLQEKVLLQFEDVETGSEEGLMGLAVDPAYAVNKYLYACYAYEKDGALVDKVVRLFDAENSITLDKVILDDIPAASNHAGCRVKFGPDGMLYVTTGDATDRLIAQDLNSIGGKILRINKNGSIPADNPFSNSPIYSLGHRNSQGIDWTEQGYLLESEHGPSGFDGAPGGDEVNFITSGANYGWPIVSHEEIDPEFMTPLEVFTPAIAPGSLMVYKSDLIPQFKGNVFIGGLRGEGLYMMSFKDEFYKEVETTVKIDEVNFGRIREVVESPTGEIYFTTSNRDGRGTLRAEDDKIYKITLANQE